MQAEAMVMTPAWHSAGPQEGRARLRRYRLRRREAGSRAKSRFMTPATSIMRWSFRRSSLGLARKVYSRPSLPSSVICAGASSQAAMMTSISLRRKAVAGTQPEVHAPLAALCEHLLWRCTEAVRTLEVHV